MSGRHAAAVDVDDEALASTEPVRPGAHRAAEESAPKKAAPRGKRAAKSAPEPEATAEADATAEAATPPTASPAPRRRAAQRKDTA